MPTIRTRSWVAAPPERVFAFFDDPANLSRLTPPPVRIELLRVDPAPPRAGSIFEFRYGIGGWQRTWTVRLLERVEGERFVDETISGPLARFHHSHSFRPARHGTWITDEIDFQVGPDGPPGALLDWLAGWLMRATFVYRHALQRWILSR